MEETRVTWVSGATLTLLNKLIFPILWFGVISGLLVWVYLTSGRISIARGFRFIAVFVVVASVLRFRLTIRLQRGGYRGSKLIIANYWREAEVPFEDIEAVEPVWWYKGRLVRLRFRKGTPFGYTVYYLAKWGPLRALFSSPDQQLREVIRTSRLG